MTRPGLDADFGKTRQPRRQGAPEAVHIGPKFRFVAVFPAHLSDLTPYGNGDPLGLMFPDKGRKPGAQFIVGPLLLGNRGLTEVHQGGGVYVDIVKTGLDGLLDELFDGLYFFFRFFLEFFVAGLEMIPLNKQRPLETFFNGRGHDRRKIFPGSLGRIAHLRTGDLKDHGPDFPLDGRLKSGPGAIIGHGPEIDGRNRKPFADFSASHGPDKIHGWRPDKSPRPVPIPRSTSRPGPFDQHRQKPPIESIDR